MTSHDDTPAPLARYLGELDTLLAGLDPGERAEIVLGVRDHVEGLLEGTDRSDHAVQAALAEVGPATAVADAAYDGRPRALPGRDEARTPVTSRSWLPVTVAVVQGLVGLGLFTVAGAMGGAVTTSSSGSGPVTDVRTGEVVQAATSTTTTTFDGGALLGGGFAAFFATLPLWLVVVVLVASSRLWPGREKLTLIALTPLGILVFFSGPALGYAVGGVDGSFVGAWAALALALLGGGALVAVLVRRALRRAGAAAVRREGASAVAHGGRVGA